jgi:hypothetical protein
MDVTELNEKILNKLTSIEDKLTELKNMSSDLNTDNDSVLKSQLEISNEIKNIVKQNKKANTIFRVHLTKELNQLKGLLIVVIAGVIFFFGIEDKQKRDDLVINNIKELITVGVALAGGYSVFTAKQNAERREEENEDT